MSSLDYDGASTSEVQDESDREKMIDPMCETDEGADGVSSEGEKTTTETTEVSFDSYLIQDSDDLIF